MNIQNTRWNTAVHLETNEDIQLYLEACMKEADDDPAFIVHALNVIARARSMIHIHKKSTMPILKKQHIN